MRVLVLTIPALLLLAGCVSTGSGDVTPAASDAESPAVLASEWRGHVLASEIEGPSHVQPTEQVIAPLVSEGFMYELKDVPTVFQVYLDWDGDGAHMIMLHSHKAEGTNAYVEHVTEMTTDARQCLRVPAEDVVAGEWQVMVHSENARDATFTITVAQVGGAGAIMQGAYHGHWPQDGAFQVEDHAIEECVDLEF